MNYKRTVLCFALLLVLLFTRVAHASTSVQINEIAWMGTSVSANAEWIELYNPTSSPLDLKGWKLSATDGSPNILLTGTISENGYFLLERTSDDTVPSITANQIYTGALSNSGEHLQLIDATGAVVDDVDASSGWPAGDDATKNTMQRNGSSWITAAPTPDAVNAAVAATTNNPNSDPNSSTTNSVTSSSNGAGITSDQDNPITPNQVQNIGKSVYELAVDPDPKYSAHVSIPDNGVVGVVVPMTVGVKIDNHHDFVSGKFIWSYGDGSSDTYLQNTPTNHIYYYPGTYNVTLSYYSNNMKDDPDYLYKKTVTIIPADVAVIGTTNDGGIIVQNNSTDTIDLDSWKLSSGKNNYTFPKYTLIQPSDSLYISSHVIGFIVNKNEQIILSNPSNVLVSKYPKQLVLGASKMAEAVAPLPFRVSDQPLQPKILPKPEVPFWDTPKLVLVFTLGLIVVILAYGTIRLYAISNSLDEDEDEFHE